VPKEGLVPTYETDGYVLQMPIQRRVLGIMVQKVLWGRNHCCMQKRIESGDFKHL
jgi:hypothetical protein